ncbi:hypothetical protein JCM11251_000516 [Rhodosporidiobolus azoricus]
MFSTLARGYQSLQTVTASGTPQSSTATIDKLCDRLLNGQQLEDRRAALLGLKGLSRDWKSDVGSRALPILLGVLEEDAKEDLEMAKAVVETLSLLCEVEEVDGRPVRDDSGLRNTDVFLATPTALHTLLTLLTPMHFYLRFFTLQLLGILLANKPAQVQQYVLTSPGGIGRLVETLDDSREIIRNESLLLMIALATQNADIQKLLAFEGAFDKLFGIVRSEGGIGSGGIVVQDCLAAVGGLLRYNISNQNYFRETSCIPLLAPLLLFPRPNALSPQSLSTFAFQSWSEQKVINAGLVISLVRMLVGGAGSGRLANQKALLQTGLTRCLMELALASNAPAVLKSQSLNALADILRLSPDNQSLLTSLIITPLIPPLAPSSPETYDHEAQDPNHPDYDPHALHGHGQHDHQHDHQQHGFEPSRNKWTRGDPVPAVVAVVSLAVDGDGTPGREGLRVRAAAAALFENYVAGANETQLGILSTMSTPQPEALDGDEGGRTESAGSILLRALRTFPSTTRNDPFDSYVPFFACLLFTHLLLHSETSKAAARKIYFQGDDTEPGGEGDPDDRSTLVSIMVGNLMMAQREQAHSQNAGLGPERALEWSRVMVGYLTVLSVWMWESPATVKEFLSEGSNLQVLIQPVTQSSGVDSVVQGLCAFLLGICYEYNREPGPITRETLHPILQSRVGADQFVSRILRLREDPRFRNIGPHVLELIDEDDASADDLGEEDGLWFDFAFVEFLKTNYISVQRAILVDPHATSNVTRSSAAPGSSEVLAAMRDRIADQSKELDDLRELVHQLQQERDEERTAFQHEVASLSDTIVSMRETINTLRSEKEEADREQEDLLVLLEDLSQKRKTDKSKLRESGVEVSEDEDEDEEPEDGEQEDGVRSEQAQPEPAHDEVSFQAEQQIIEPPYPDAEPFRQVAEPVRQILEPVREVVKPVREVVEPVRDVVNSARSFLESLGERTAPHQLVEDDRASANGSITGSTTGSVSGSAPGGSRFPRPASISASFVSSLFGRHTPTPQEPPRLNHSQNGFAAPPEHSYNAYPSSPKREERSASPMTVPPPPKTGESRPYNSYVPPPPKTGESRSYSPFTYAPPPKAGEKPFDPYAPPPKQEEREEVQGEEAEIVPEEAPKTTPAAVGAEEEEPREAYPPPMREELPFDPYAPPAKQDEPAPEVPPAEEEPRHDPFALPRPKKEEEQDRPYDPFAPESFTEGPLRDPYAPPSLGEQSHDPFAPPPQADQPGPPFSPPPAADKPHDPFASSSIKDTLAEFFPTQTVEAKKTQDEPLVSPPPKQQQQQPTVRHDAFASASSLFGGPPSQPASAQETQEEHDRPNEPDYNPFGGRAANDDVFASIQHSRAGSPSLSQPAEVPPRNPFGAPSHDPIGAPSHDPFGARAHDPFAPAKEQQQQQHDRPSSSPFGLAASSASQQQDDPYSPFGGQNFNNDPFGLNSSSQSSAANDEPYSPFNPRPSSASSQSHSQHKPTRSHRDVSDLFR